MFHFPQHVLLYPRLFLTVTMQPPMAKLEAVYNATPRLSEQKNIFSNLCILILSLNSFVLGPAVINTHSIGTAVINNNILIYPPPPTRTAL